MEFNDYQKKAKKTDTYTTRPDRLLYATLGLAGESGEVAEKVKKILRDKKGVISEEKKQELLMELGDVLWYIAKFARELGVSLDDVAEKNIEKLYSRLERGKISGDGDNR